MASLPISREKALELIKENNKDSSDMNHYLESEAIMRELARKLGKDENYWAMLGLLHDIDWGKTKGNSQEHLTLAPDILTKAGFDEEFTSIIISHGFGFDCAGLKEKTRTREIEYALACSETITGLVHAYALMRGKRISDMEAKGLKKKFNDKNFAAAVSREIISECEKINISLDEFFNLSINAIKNIKEDVGLM